MDHKDPSIVTRTVGRRHSPGLGRLGDAHHCSQDSVVSGAAAQVAREGDSDFIVGRIGVGGE